MTWTVTMTTGYCMAGLHQDCRPQPLGAGTSLCDCDCHTRRSAMRVPIIISQFQPERTDIEGYLPLDDEDFIWCENAGDRPGSLAVGLTIAPPTPEQDIESNGGIYLDITLDEIRKLQAQLQRVIDDNPE